jgi:hypothetical protein
MYDQSPVPRFVLDRPAIDVSDDGAIALFPFVLDVPIKTL